MLVMFVMLMFFVYYEVSTNEGSEAVKGQNVAMILLLAGFLIAHLGAIFLSLSDQGITKQMPLWKMLVVGGFAMFGLLLWVLNSSYCHISPRGAWATMLDIGAFHVPLVALAALTWGTFVLDIWEFSRQIRRNYFMEADDPRRQWSNLEAKLLENQRFGPEK